MNAFRLARQVLIRFFAVDLAASIWIVAFGVAPLLVLLDGLLVERRYFPVAGLWALLLPAIGALLIARHLSFPVARSGMDLIRYLWRVA